ncbi:unnamed protein product, partial [Meganyctiphanes norvegica]
VFPQAQSITTVRVPEDLPLGALVSMVPAYDPDSKKLRYTIENDDYKGMFIIDSDTAVIRLASALDYERRSVYNVTVWATDDGSPPMKAHCHVIIQVVDVNENIHAPVFGQDVVETTVSEATPPHTLVVSVPALDADQNVLDATVTYRLL